MCTGREVDIQMDRLNENKNKFRPLADTQVLTALNFRENSQDQRGGRRALAILGSLLGSDQARLRPVLQPRPG